MVDMATPPSLASGSRTLKAISSLRFISIVLAALYKQAPTPTSSLDVGSSPPLWEAQKVDGIDHSVFGRVQAGVLAHLSLSSAAFSASSSFCRAVARRS